MSQNLLIVRIGFCSIYSMVKVKNNYVFLLNLPNVETSALPRHLFSLWLFCSLHFSLPVKAAVPNIPVLCNLQMKG